MTIRTIRALSRSRTAFQPRLICQQCRLYSDAPPAAPLLVKLRTDLKTAMKAKDTNRLNVLRTLLAEITNAAKTPNPITSDIQLLSLLRKRAAAAKDASDEFSKAGRQDLVDRENAQAAILQELTGGVETMSETDMKDAVAKVVEAAKAAAEKINMGDVLKRLLGPGGILEGKPVEKSQVARIVKQVLS